MTEPLFAPAPKSMSVAEIAALTGAQVLSAATAERRIANVAPLDRAGPRDLAYIDHTRLADQLAATRAGVCLISERLEGRAPPHVALLRVEEPYQAFVAVASRLFPGAMRPSSMFAGTGVAGATIHPEARLEAGVIVDPCAVVGPGAEIGAGSVIAANAVIGPSVRIGRDCSIGAGASLSHAIVGDRVIVHPGCRIGQDGFGFIMGPGGHRKVPQIGRVIIQDDVEIGANTTVDRGAFRDTVIGEGTKIDNLVQIAHNVSIGRHCVIVSQSGIAGSATIEDYVVLGARVGVIDHATIGEGAQLAATSSVHADVPAGARWGGTPAKPLKAWFKEMMMLERMAARADEVRNAKSNANRSNP